jgi:hypothetical protein
VHDLAGAHFSIETIALMNENLKFGVNTTNTPNVPQARLIEILWGILAQKIYEGGWKATTLQELISHMQSQLKNWLKCIMRIPIHPSRRVIHSSIHPF